MLAPSLPVQDIDLKFKPYLDWRLRLERRLDRDFASSVDDDRTDILNRFRPGVEWTSGKRWSGELQYQITTDNMYARPGNLNDDASDLNLAYARFRDGNVDVTIGRQKINVGSERLIGTLEWSMAGRAFDGARIKIGRWDAFAFKVGVAAPKPGRARIVGATYKSDYGLTQVYFKHDNLPGNPDTDNWTLAHAWDRKWDRLAVESEAAIQTGHTGGKNLRAWAIHGGVTYASTPSTKLFLDLNAASGGGNADTTYTFDNLLPTNHKFYGSMDLQSWRNMEELALGVDHKFDAKWSAKLSWRAFRLRDASDAWYGAAGGPNRGVTGPFVDPAGASGQDVGREIDLEFFYKHNQRISAAAGLGLFFPGGFVKARNGGQADPQRWAYFMLQMRF